MVTGGLIFNGIFPGNNILFYTLVIFAILVHVTAIQRFFRGVKVIITQPNPSEKERT